jgi:hypothetical protein
MITGEYEPEGDARIILKALDGLKNKNVLGRPTQIQNRLPVQ